MTKQLLHKYFTGNCTPEELNKVMNYLDGDDHTLLNECLDEIAVNTNDGPVLNKTESDTLLNSIYEQIGFGEEDHNSISSVLNSSKESVKKTWLSGLSVRIAASVALILACAGIFQLWVRNHSDKYTTQVEPQWATVNNNTINIKKLQMPDGTNVWLNAHSSLTYNTAIFNRAKREVRISGEAFFEVAHNKAKPFVVVSGNVSTTVLGTVFNVEAYKAEKEIKVILIEGKVSVKANTANHILTPGHILKYTKANRHIAVNAINTRDISSWTTGKLVFTDVALHDALNRIAGIYNISIQFNDTIALHNKRLTGVFERKSAESVLGNILFVYGLKYEKKGGVYRINY